MKLKELRPQKVNEGSPQFDIPDTGLVAMLELIKRKELRRKRLDEKLRRKPE